jgi:hypothetical protein
MKADEFIRYFSLNVFYCKNLEIPKTLLTKNDTEVLETVHDLHKTYFFQKRKNLLKYTAFFRPSGACCSSTKKEKNTCHKIPMS